MITHVGNPFHTPLTSDSKLVHWHEQGVKVMVPRNAVTENQRLKICTCNTQYMSFNVPDHMELVSAVYEFTCTGPSTLKKKVEIAMVHAIPLKSKSTHTDLTFVCSSLVPHWKGNMTPSYNLKALSGGSFKADIQTGVIGVTELNMFLAIASKQQFVLKFISLCMLCTYI